MYRALLLQKKCFAIVSTLPFLQQIFPYCKGESCCLTWRFGLNPVNIFQEGSDEVKMRWNVSQMGTDSIE